MSLVAIIVATVLPLTALADTVIVIRGSEPQLPPGSQENGVVVMRPAPGSFMRETTRLAKEAEARDERAAREAAQEANVQLREVLRALENAADAVGTLQGAKRNYVVAPTLVRRTITDGPGKLAQHSAPVAPFRDRMPMNGITDAL